MNKQLIPESKDLLLKVTNICNRCDNLLRDESRSRESQQSIFELKAAAASFQHEILNFMGVEGTPEEPKPGKEVLFRASH